MPFFFRFRPVSLQVNQILDILEEEDTGKVDEIYLVPSEGDDSDSYDVSDTEEGESSSISRTILQVNGRQ